MLKIRKESRKNMGLFFLRQTYPTPFATLEASQHSGATLSRRFQRDN